MKISPSVRAEQTVPVDAQRFRDWYESLRTTVEYDRDHRREWLEDKEYWWRRRYGKERGSPNYPWPGASEIVMPLIDMVCDRMKAMIAGYVANTTPPVTVLAATPEQQKQIPTIEMLFEWLVKVGSPNFMQELLLGTDTMVECGRMILKTFWSYQTRIAPETLSRRSLPQELRRYISVGTEQAAQVAMKLTGTEWQSDKSFKQQKQQLDQDLQLYMDLDATEPADRKAMDQIAEWLKAGAPDQLTIKKKDTQINAPAIMAVDPAYLIMPAGAMGIEQAPQITHEMMFTETEMRQMGRDYRWEPRVVDELLKLGVQGPQGVQSDWMYSFYPDREDYDASRWRKKNLYRVYETCTHMDYNKDGRDEKVVITWSPDYTKAPLKAIAYQRPSGKWPYHTAPFELNRRDWYSPRGVPEKLNDLDWEITQQHRSKLNRMTIANAPVFTYKMHKAVNPENIRFIPGQMIPVYDGSDIQELRVNNLDMSFEREEQTLRTWAEQYLGSADFGLANPLSNLSEARTATEVRTIQSLSKQSLTLRALPLQTMLREVYGEFFDLWMTYGPEEVSLRVTGAPPFTVSREDLQGDYQFIISGAIGEDDPALKAQKAMTRLQLLMQIQAAGGLGDEYELNLAEATLDVLETDDVRAARRIVRKRSPQEVQQIQQEREQASRIQGMLTGMNAKPPGGGGQGAKPSGGTGGETGGGGGTGMRMVS